LGVDASGQLLDLTAVPPAIQIAIGDTAGARVSMGEDRGQLLGSDGRHE
jgi:hypothetical protein